jgi:hypothetical protein
VPQRTQAFPSRSLTLRRSEAEGRFLDEGDGCATQPIGGTGLCVGQ